MKLDRVLLKMLAMEGEEEDGEDSDWRQLYRKPAYPFRVVSGIVAILYCPKCRCAEDRLDHEPCPADAQERVHCCLGLVKKSTRTIIVGQYEDGGDERNVCCTKCDTVINWSDSYDSFVEFLSKKPRNRKLRMSRRLFLPRGKCRESLIDFPGVKEFPYMRQDVEQTWVGFSDRITHGYLVAYREKTKEVEYEWPEYCTIDTLIDFRGRNARSRAVNSEAMRIAKRISPWSLPQREYE